MKRTLVVLSVALILLLTACSSNTTGDGTATDALASTVPTSADAPSGEDRGKITVYASPDCGCCHLYIPYLEQNGFVIEEIEVDDINAPKEKYGVPQEAWSCHTSVIGDYFIEGHVPVEAIDKLLEERPDIDGIALPRMPLGSPGMNGQKTAPFEIVAVNGGKVTPFMTI